MNAPQGSGVHVDDRGLVFEGGSVIEWDRPVMRATLALFDEMETILMPPTHKRRAYRDAPRSVQLYVFRAAHRTVSAYQGREPEV